MAYSSSRGTSGKPHFLTHVANDYEWNEDHTEFVSMTPRRWHMTASTCGHHISSAPAATATASASAAQPSTRSSRILEVQSLPGGKFTPEQMSGTARKDLQSNADTTFMQELKDTIAGQLSTIHGPTPTCGARRGHHLVAPLTNEQHASVLESQQSDSQFPPSCLSATDLEMAINTPIEDRGVAHSEITIDGKEYHRIGLGPARSNTRSSTEGSVPPWMSTRAGATSVLTAQGTIPEAYYSMPSAQAQADE